MPGDEADASDLQETMRRLNVALLDAVDRLQLDESGEMAPEAQLLLSLTQRERLKKQVQQSKTMLALIEQLTEMDRLLGDVDEAIGHQRFVAAAEGVAEVESLVYELVNVEKGEGGNVDDRKIIRVVKLQLLSKKNRLLNQLTSAGYPDAKDERYCQGHLAAPHQADAADPRGTLKQMRNDSGVTLKIVAQNAKDVSTDSEVAEVQRKCANVVSVLQFVHAELFAGNAELMNLLGDFMWKIPGNLEAQLMNLLQDKIPQDAAALEAYRGVLTAAITSLENTLVAIGFSACSNSQLRGFVDQLNQLHSKKRRQVILSNGRDMMRRDYHDSVKIKGASEKCSLTASSGSARKAKVLARETASGAAKSNRNNGGYDPFFPRRRRLVLLIRKNFRKHWSSPPPPAVIASGAQAAKFVPSIGRLSKLPTILMDPLTTVRDKFNSGSLDAFSSKELAVLVR
ncbi:RZZ complex, subunit Zw10 [Phytophthora cactorum]|nr:RZZ complex, subunit Zw10 [Phytophthora cactorum]